MEDPEYTPGPGEPGFDPDLWEECEEEEEGFIIFFGKILIAMIAITLVTYFFWFLEQQKKKQKDKDKKHGETDEVSASSDPKQEPEPHDLLEGRTVQHLQYEPNSVEVVTSSIDSDSNRTVTVAVESKDFAVNGVGVHGEAVSSAHLDKIERVVLSDDSANDHKNKVDASSMEIQVTRPSDEGSPTRIKLKGSQVSAASALNGDSSGIKEAQSPECSPDMTPADIHISENGMPPRKSSHGPTEVLHNKDAVPSEHSPEQTAMSERQTDYQENHTDSEVEPDKIGTMRDTQVMNSPNENSGSNQDHIVGAAPAENLEHAKSENVSTEVDLAPSKGREEISLLKFDEATDLKSTISINAESEPNIQEVKQATLEESEPPNSAEKKEKFSGRNNEPGKDEIEQESHKLYEQTPLTEPLETSEQEKMQPAVMDAYDNEPSLVQTEEEMGKKTNSSLSSSRKKGEAKESAADGEPASPALDSLEDLLKNANDNISSLPTEIAANIVYATVGPDATKIDDVNQSVQVSPLNQSDDLKQVNQDGTGIMEKSTESSKTITSESSFAQADSLKPEDKQEDAKTGNGFVKASEEVKIPSETDKENLAELMVEEKTVVDAEAEPRLSADSAAQFQATSALEKEQLEPTRVEKPADGMPAELPNQRTAARVSSEATSGASLSTVEDLSIDKSLQKVKVTADQRENLDATYDKIKTKIMTDDIAAAEDQGAKPIGGETQDVQVTQKATMDMIKTKGAAGEATAATNAVIEPPLQVAADLPIPPTDQWEVEASVSVSLPSLSSEPDEMPSITTAPEIESYAAGERADSEIREELPNDEPVSNVHVQQSAPAFVASRPKELGKPQSNRHKSPQIDVDIAVTTPSPPQSPVSSNKVSSILEVLGTSSLTEALMKIQTLQQVSEVMRQAGLQSSNLIFGNTQFYA